MDASDPDGVLENIASVIGRRWKLTWIYRPFLNLSIEHRGRTRIRLSAINRSGKKQLK
jgi:hypothetical protein